MAGGVNTPELVSEVINKGAIGSYGFAYSKPKQIFEDIRSAKKLIDKNMKGALNCNFIIFPKNPSDPVKNESSARVSLIKLNFAGI